MYREFWDLFVKQYGGLRGGMAVFVLTTAVSLLEGLNIGLLIPLLETLKPPGEEGRHWVSRAMAGLFDSLGVPFELWTVVLTLGLFVLVLSGLKYLRMVLVAKMVRGFTVWMRLWVMHDLLHADMSYFHRQTLGRLTDTLTTQVHRAGISLTMITDISASAGVIFAYLVAALVVSPILTGVAVAMVLIVSLAMQFHILRAKAMSIAMVQAEKDLQAAGLENLSGIHVVKAFLLEQLRGKAYADTARQLGDTTYYLEKNRSQIIVLQEIALFGLVGGVVLVGVAWLGLNITLIVTLLFILYRLMPRITGLNAQRQGLLAGLASLKSVQQVAESTARPEIVSGEKPFTRLSRCIELQGVNFSYNETAHILKDTSFTVEKGEMTAIIGTSGAGKTTLVDLMLRIYDPVKGRILVDGVDLRELDLASWRRSIGVVSQDVFLFNDTIAGNIALERPGANMESIVAAARQAYAHDFIQELPEEYETQVGDRGWNLSGGQRQRIALARAILKKPDILILDEATSSLDSESEQLIHRYMREIRGTCTMVVVAHRMSTIQDADKIVVLQDGKIVEEGNWDSLLAGEGVFANYHKLQSVG